ncbi:MAG TPA: DUF5647 family protein [Anaerolineales bacterium]|nr:DUF5647 family protein [Anaerolineales bacterium]
MAKRKVSLTENEVVKRNIDLHSAFMQYTLEHPELLDKLPPEFRLVILPENDSALRAYNLELLDQHPARNKPVIFVRMRVEKKIDFNKQRPTVYLPLAA